MYWREVIGGFLKDSYLDFGLMRWDQVSWSVCKHRHLA